KIKGEHVPTATELAVEAVAIAKPELVLRANALAVILRFLAKSIIKTSVLTIDGFGYFYPLTGSFEIDTVFFTLVVID
ncbi:MAG: hypothetical protein RSA20_08215, partial [Oscillospiraceae bacterium]